MSKKNVTDEVDDITESVLNKIEKEEKFEDDFVELVMNSKSVEAKRHLMGFHKNEIKSEYVKSGFYEKDSVLKSLALLRMSSDVSDGVSKFENYKAEFVQAIKERSNNLKLNAYETIIRHGDDTLIKSLHIGIMAEKHPSIQANYISKLISEPLKLTDGLMREFVKSGWDAYKFSDDWVATYHDPIGRLLYAAELKGNIKIPEDLVLKLMSHPKNAHARKALKLKEKMDAMSPDSEDKGLSLNISGFSPGRKVEDESNNEMKFKMR